ncbi:hypothetical protein NDU88_004667 [Pleurodeles waltl]|uniref:Uncharacterized protein n=1 Tax=Pleurodeles waltl TaxID=8319 RepID=A0AAV7T843_PLEWA|nr:hypothetical protein NDU88_004667 [Pleurodeles waltl]
MPVPRTKSLVEGFGYTYKGFRLDKRIETGAYSSETDPCFPSPERFEGHCALLDSARLSCDTTLTSLTHRKSSSYSPLARTISSVDNEKHTRRDLLGDGEQDGGRVTQPRSVCSDQGNLPVLRQFSRGSELPSAVALRGKQCSGILATLCRLALLHLLPLFLGMTVPGLSGGAAQGKYCG